MANWLYKVFLHIVLPPEKSLMVKHRIDYPQNLIAFVFVSFLIITVVFFVKKNHFIFNYRLFFELLYLLKRLIEVGYPNHWIVVVLDSILDGKITV